MSLENQVAIVTGASSGIGRAIAERLALAGAAVVINHPPSEGSRAKADDVVRTIEGAGGEAVAIAADVS